jgi:hypothetical protein
MPKGKSNVFKTLSFLMLLLVAVILVSGCEPKTQEEKDLKEAEKILNQLPGGKDTKLSRKEKEKRITAKQAFELAEKEAKKWDKDAFLIEVSNFFGSEESDGLYSTWTLKFASPNKDNDRLEITVSDGKIFRQEERKNYMQPHPVVDNWIDSPEAMKIVRQYCQTEETENYWLGLGINTWSIKCKRPGKKPFWVDVNATTGEFIKTREGY